MVSPSGNRTVRPDSVGLCVRRKCYYYPPECDPDDRRPVTLALIMSIQRELQAIGRDAFGIVARVRDNTWWVVVADPITADVIGLCRYGDLDELNREWELD